MPYRLCIPPSQSERIAEPLDRGARGVVAGVPVQIAGDADRRVAEQVGRGLDMDARFQPADAAEWRSVCAPTSSMPAFSAAISTVRSRLRGSTHPPTSVANTAPVSVHWSPACNRSAICRLAVRLQLGDEAGGQRNAPARPIGLRRSPRQRASDAHDDAGHGQLTLGEVDVGPPQAGDFTAAHSGRRDGPERPAGTATRPGGSGAAARRRWIDTAPL